MRFHVVPHLNKGWRVKRGGSILELYRTNRKSLAIGKGLILLMRYGGELYIHRNDGSICKVYKHKVL